MNCRLCTFSVLLFLTATLCSSGCFTPESEKPIVLQPPASDLLKKDDERLVTVQHILINFETTLPGSFVPRDQAQAKALAEELKQRADSGEDFKGMIDEFSADKEGMGTYTLADDSIERTMLPPSINPRKSMVKSFGDVAFALEIGEVGIAEYDEQDCPYGYHVIKRVK